jgi:DNA-directed RNA polymerase subunit E'/Rpb7
MDPLFERRELVRNIHLDAKFLQRNIDASLTSQLRMRYEGTCVAEGYIARESIVVVDHSLGRTNLIKGGLDYTVRFQADVCMPHPGQRLRAPVVLKSKIGIHAETTPVKILLPRDLHIGNPAFDDVEEKQEVEFEVIGAKFQQGDQSIVLLGKLIETIKPLAPEEEPAMAIEPLIAASAVASTTGQTESTDKKVVTVDVAATMTKDTAPRRVRIKPKTATTTNEQKPEGTT